MRIRAAGILVSAAIALAMSAAPAIANSWAGSDPGANFPMPYIPQLCWNPPTGDPTGAACLDWSVGVLDQARASLGLPAYVVPADFDSLTPAQQLFILTNSDRAQYGLDPIPGLTDALNQNAASGVQDNSDPWPTGSNWMAYTSNWAGGYVNAVLAYEGWMYDDGPGSGNQDCTSTNPSGCWGHRHDVLWDFAGSGGATAMGAAAGSYTAGQPSYAMLLVQGSDTTYQPIYTYTWTQAVADGANGGVASNPGATSSSTGSDTGSTGSGSTGSTGTTAGSTGSGSSTGSDTGSTGASTGSGSGSTDSGFTGSSAGSGSSASGSSNGSGAGTSGSGPGSDGSGSRRPGSSHEPGAHVAQVSVAVARLRVRGHHIRVHLVGSRGLSISCSLRHWTGRRWRTERSKRCSAWTLFRYVPSGHYRLRVSSMAGTFGRRVVVR